MREKSLIVIICLLSILGVLGHSAAEMRLSGEDEERARALFSELRCVVCQNQSIDSSDADVAKDLRQLVREKISEGLTNDDIRSFLVSRYGEFVLLKPAVGWHTIWLWLAPLAILIVGGLACWMALRRTTSQKTTQLSEAEERQIRELLGNGD